MMHRKTRNQLGLVILGLVILILFAAWFSAKSTNLPAYQGKTAAEWFYGDHRNPRLLKTVEEAKLAFDAMGTNCIPYLVEVAKGEETVFNRFYCRLHPKLPSFIRARIRPANTAHSIQMRAFDYLRRFESQQLDPFASELMKIVPTIADNLSRELAFWVIETSTMGAENIEFSRDYYCEFLNDPSFNVRLEAAVVLSRVDPSITNGIDTLIFGITNNTPRGAVFLDFPRPSLLHTQERAYNALSLVAPEVARSFKNPTVKNYQEPARSRFDGAPFPRGLFELPFAD